MAFAITCPECGLPDRGGTGDGLGSCDCPPLCLICRARPYEDGCLCDDDEDDYGDEEG